MQPFEDIYRKEERKLFRRRRARREEVVTPPPAPAAPEQVSPRHSHPHRRRRPGSTTHLNRTLALITIAFGGVMMVLVLVLFQQHQADLRERMKKATPTAKAKKTNKTESALDFDVGRQLAAWKSVPDVLIEAEGLQRKLEHEAAIKKLEAALEVTPRSVLLQKMLADVLMEAGRSDQAVEVLARVVESDSSDLSTRLKLGRSLAEAGDTSGSLAVAQWVLEADIYSVEAHQMAAQAYLKLDRIREALPHLRRITTLDVGNLGVQNELGEAYRRSGDVPQALKVFQDVLKQDPGNMDAYVNMAACFAEQSDTNQAVDTLNRAVLRFGRPAVEKVLGDTRFDPIRTHPFFEISTAPASSAGAAVPAPPAGGTPQAEGAAGGVFESLLSPSSAEPSR